MTAPPSVTDNEERSRLELRVDDELAGWLDYRPAGDSIIVAHTEVMHGHEGEGLGGVLVRSALDAARAAGKTVIATCPFASSYIDRHPELDEFLAPYARRRRPPD
jgi:predicted GNAT family acetyltransferase